VDSEGPPVSWQPQSQERCVFLTSAMRSLKWQAQLLAMIARIGGMAEETGTRGAQHISTIGHKYTAPTMTKSGEMKCGVCKDFVGL
jgi:hypothetical protein